MSWRSVLLLTTTCYSCKRGPQYPSDLTPGCQERFWKATGARRGIPSKHGESTIVDTGIDGPLCKNNTWSFFSPMATHHPKFQLLWSLSRPPATMC
ncbi:peroxisome biogenesis factor 2 isoform 2-T2 [Anomaloglossus baeobatrachus]